MAGNRAKYEHGSGNGRAPHRCVTVASVTEVSRQSETLLVLKLTRHRHKFSYDNYTSLWNVLDYCATTMPVTNVSPEDTKPEYKARNGIESKIWQDCMFNAFSNELPTNRP